MIQGFCRQLVSQTSGKSCLLLRAGIVGIWDAMSHFMRRFGPETGFFKGKWGWHWPCFAMCHDNNTEFRQPRLCVALRLLHHGAGTHVPSLSYHTRLGFALASCWNRVVSLAACYSGRQIPLSAPTVQD